MIFHQVGENDRAIDLIKKALTIKPDDAEIHNSLGTALRDLGKQEDAFKNHQRAVNLDPQNDSFWGGMYGFWSKKNESGIVNC